jgi:uncharacterized protein with HEPN domain
VKDQRVYLRHILRCGRRIEEYTRGGRSAFLASPLLQDATLRNLQTMAESTQRLDESLKARHQEVDWPALAGFRNVLVHDYLGIDLERVYDSIEEHLPGLLIAVESLLREAEGLDQDRTQP